MKNTKFTLVLLLLCALVSNAQDWQGIAVPAPAGQGKSWQLQAQPSDDFNYNFNETNQRTNFGANKWYNFYHNGWDGPGTTYWQFNHVSVNGSDLVLRASRNPSTVKMGVPGINAGCITSNSRVKFPVFVESRVSVADIALASDVWLLSPDDTQEIDIIECYGGDEQGNSFFAQFIHLSHHSFIRNPFTDYQPRDFNSWWDRPGVGSWGEWSWNNGNRRYVRIGVNWISPFHFEYYIDGNLVRVMYNNATATNRNGVWSYTYPSMTNGKLDVASDGFQKGNVFASNSGNYNFQTLKNASDKSTVSVIDPFNFQNGTGFNKAMDIIVNVESQNWHVDAGRTPTDGQLRSAARNKMLVDWIRVYKPVNNTGGGGTTPPPTTTPPTTTNPPAGGNDGSFFIVNRQTGKKLRPKSAADGSELTLVNANVTTNWVKWLAVKAPNGYYLANKQTGKYFRPATADDNSPIQQRPVTFTGNFTQWKRVNTNGGYFHLENISTGKYFRPATDTDPTAKQVPSSFVGSYTQWKFVNTVTGAAAKQFGEDSSETSNMKVFPNPANVGATVNILGVSGSSVSVYDVTGAQVKKAAVDGNSSQIETSNLSKGLYFVKTNTKTVKFLVK